LKYLGNDSLATPDWDGHLGRLTHMTSANLLRRHEHFEEKRKAQAGAKELERWVNAVKHLLGTNKIKKLVIRGDPDWCSVLFSTSPLVKALLEFKGQDRINQVYKAGRWPKSKSGEEKVLQMLKATLERDVEKVEKPSTRRQCSRRSASGLVRQWWTRRWTRRFSLMVNEWTSGWHLRHLVAICAS
jgi:hypothetical protein